jgi:hypothetical protein
MEKQRRPFVVTILCLGVLCFVIYQCLGVIAVIQQWNLSFTILTLSPLYLLLRNLLWGLCGIFILWNIWRGNRKALNYLRFCFLIYVFGSWLEWIFLLDSVDRNISFLVVNAIYLSLFLIITLIFSLSSVKNFFGEGYVR